MMRGGAGMIQDGTTGTAAAVVVIATLLLVLQGAPVALVSAQLDLRFTGASSYDITVDGSTWFASEKLQFHVDGSWLVAGQELSLKSNATSTGTNAYGAYTRYSLTWASSTLQFETAFDVYTSQDRIMFTQTWLSGGTNTSAGSMDQVLSAFPSFDTTHAPPVKMGVMGFQGHFLDNDDNGPQLGVFPNGIVGGNTGGPMAFFDLDTMGTTVVFAPASNFMMANVEATSSYMRAGIMATGTEVPPGYSVAFSLTLAKNGVNNAFQAWGNALLKFYKKTTALRDADLPVHNLGYNTDHGSYYYYNPKNPNYNITLVELWQSAKEQGIPYNFILLDSWWYYKGVGDGVKEWVATPETFPPGGVEGLKAFNDITKWPVIGHNRYWAQDTVYAKENGGKFEFTSNQYKMVAPLEQAFWDYLLSTSVPWGLHTYEQDWLYNEFEGVPYLHENVTMGREWLLQMGRAATKNNVTIQYCMPNPRHALQSAEIQPVTHVRASGDYTASHALKQWHLGYSSILASALGLAPFKDNFWSTSVQPGTSEVGAMEPAPGRQCAVSTMTSGPVTPGDGIPYQNKTIIMRSCRSDGVLLQPDRPATAMDLSIKATILNDSSAGPLGKVWATYTTVAGQRYDHIFASELSNDTPFWQGNLTLDLATSRAGEPLVAYTLDAHTMDPETLRVGLLGESKMFTIRKSRDPNDFSLTHTSPILPNGIAILGELSKYVPTAPKRISSISVSASTTTVGLTGARGEALTLHAFDATINTVSSSSCTIDSSHTCSVTFSRKAV